LAFVFALGDCLTAAFARVIIPRLSLTGFIFAQPLLISRVLRYLEQADASHDKFESYRLVALTAGIYLGIAVRIELKVSRSD
jgi:ATP-binding cassette, subfamily C (CFTR/MRP), member 1